MLTARTASASPVLIGNFGLHHLPLNVNPRDTAERQAAYERLNCLDGGLLDPMLKSNHSPDVTGQLSRLPTLTSLWSRPETVCETDAIMGLNLTFDFQQ